MQRTSDIHILFYAGRGFLFSFGIGPKDDRRIVWGSCFSIEPGIYKDGIGVRSEIDVLIDSQGNLSVAGPEQDKLILLE